MPENLNRQWTLTERPTGEPSIENFELHKKTVPEPGPKEVLVQICYLSVDPYMRGRMRDKESYSAPWEIGDPMRARAVGKVIKSNYDDLTSGDLVTGNLYWSEYAVVDGASVDLVDTGEAPISTALHVLGKPGQTAYIGMVEIGRVKPGDTVVVSGAAGAVGSIAGQIARIAGCQVVGIAGSDKKTAWLENDLGFDDTINYRQTNNLSIAVKKACPHGVDLYFENVGGEISDAVLDHLANYSRVAVCGKISLYNLESNDEKMTGPRRLYQRTRTRVEGFIVNDYDHLAKKVKKRLAGWINEDEICYDETITEGIENAPRAFLGLFKGENTGKQLVKVNC
jgi:NADPH-dependent curcumin reductase CurA